jgi:hypothetical protein
MHLRRRDDLGLAAAGEGTQDLDDERGLQHPQVVQDSPPTDLTGPGESSGFEQPAALRQQQFEQPLKTMPPFEPEQFLDSLRPVSVHPFLELALRQLV